MAVARVGLDPAAAANRGQMDQHRDAVAGDHDLLDLLMELRPFGQEILEEPPYGLATAELVAAGQLPALVPCSVGVQRLQGDVDVTLV